MRTRPAAIEHALALFARALLVVSMVLLFLPITPTAQAATSSRFDISVDMTRATVGDTYTVSVGVDTTFPVISLKMHWRNDEAGRTIIQSLEYDPDSSKWVFRCKVSDSTQNGFWYIKYLACETADDGFAGMWSSSDGIGVTVFGSAADSEKPVIDEGSFSIDCNQAVAGDTITLSVKMTDNVAVTRNYVYFRNFSTNKLETLHLSKREDTGDWWQCTYKVTEDTVSGHYYIYYAECSDALGNTASSMQGPSVGNCVAIGLPDEASHQYVEDPAQEATCTQDGITRGEHCRLCGYVQIKQQVVKALGHDYKTRYINPTCDSDGYTISVCSRCLDKQMTIDEGTVLTEDGRHTPVVDADTDPTCIKPGYSQGAHCSVCGKVTTKPTVIAPLGHSFSNWTVIRESTCTESGLRKGGCERCGEIVEQIVEPNHLWGDWSVEHAATCDKAPVLSRTCLKDSEHVQRVGGFSLNSDIRALEGHSYMVIEERVSWTAARAICEDLGGHLVTIASEEEQRFVESMKDPWLSAWIGAKRAQPGSEAWEWVTGEEWAYSNWRQGEPSSPDRELFAALWPDSWNDLRDDSGEQSGFICEWDGQAPSFIHDIGSWSMVKETSCNDYGVEQGKCSRCDGAFERYVAPLGHDWGDWSVTKEPTCTAEGAKVRTCARCLEEETAFLPAEHSWGDWQVTEEPACETPGMQTRKCLVCQEMQQAELTAAHNWGDWQEIEKATCSSGGTMQRVCLRDSSHVQTLDGDTVCQDGASFDGHYYRVFEAQLSWTEAKNACEEMGGHLVTIASEEEQRFVESVKDPRLSAWIGAKRAQPGSEAWEWVTGEEWSYSNWRQGEPSSPERELFAALWPDSWNDLCDDSWEQSGFICEWEPGGIAPLAHECLAWTVEREPTCVEEGTKSGICSLCGETVSDPIAPLGHSYGNYELTQSATCVDEGVMTRSCTRCQVEERDYIVPLGHSFGSFEVTREPTCSDEGVKTRYCSRCQMEDRYYYSSLGHDWGDPIDIVPATCTEGGLAIHSCLRDAAHIEVYRTSALGHTVVVDPAIDVTCTKDGLTAGSHCSVCGEVFVEQRVIGAPGHDTVVDEALEATCTEDGLTEGLHCARCNEVLVAQEKVMALGHDWGEWRVETPSTCTDDGEEIRVCSRDDSHAESRVIVAVHTPSVEKGIEATCTEPGLTDRVTCSVCKQVLQAREMIPAFGHDWGELTLIARPEGVGTTGTAIHSCGRCENAQETIEVLYGDLNGDKQFSVVDLVMLQRSLAGLSKLSGLHQQMADVCADDVLDMKDLLMMARQLLV